MLLVQECQNLDQDSTESDFLRESMRFISDENMGVLRTGVTEPILVLPKYQRRKVLCNFKTRSTVNLLQLYSSTTASTRTTEARVLYCI